MSCDRRHYASMDEEIWNGWRGARRQEEHGFRTRGRSRAPRGRSRPFHRQQQNADWIQSGCSRNNFQWRPYSRGNTFSHYNTRGNRDFQPGYYKNNNRGYTKNRPQSGTLRGRGNRFICPSNPYNIARIELSSLPDKDLRPANRVRSKSSSDALDFNHKKHAKVLHHRKLILKNWTVCFEENILASCRLTKQKDRKCRSVACLADLGRPEQKRLQKEWATLKSRGQAVAYSQRKKGCFINYTNITEVNISKLKEAQQKMRTFRIPKKPQPQTFTSPTGKENLDISSHSHPVIIKSKDVQHVSKKISTTTHHSQATPTKKRHRSDHKENKMEATKQDGSRAPSAKLNVKSAQRKSENSHKDKFKSERKRRHSDTIDAHIAKHQQLGQPEEQKEDCSKEAIESINRKLRKCKKLVVVLERMDIRNQKEQQAITNAESEIRADTDDESIGKMISVTDDIPITKTFNNLLQNLESFSDESFRTELEPSNLITEASKNQEYQDAGDDNNLDMDQLQTLSDSNGEDGSDKVSEDIFVCSKIDEIFPDLLEVAKHLPEVGILDTEETEILIDIEDVDWSIILGSPPSFENKFAKCIDNDELAISLFKIYEEFLDHEFTFNRNLFHNALSTSRQPANSNISFEYSIQHHLLSIRFYECLDEHFVQNVDVNVFLKRIFVLSEENMCVYACCLLRLLDSHVCSRTTFAHNFLSKIWKVTSLLHYINPKAFETMIYSKCKNKDDARRGRFLQEVDEFNNRKVMRMMAKKSPTCEDKILRELFCGDAEFGHPEPLKMFASRMVLTMDEISATWHEWLINTSSQAASDIDFDDDTIVLRPEDISLCSNKLEVEETCDNGRSGLSPTYTITTAAQLSTGVQKHPEIRAIPIKLLQSQIIPTHVDMPIIAATYQDSAHQSSVARQAFAESPSNIAFAHQLSAITQNHITQSQPPVKVTTPQSTISGDMHIIAQTSSPPVASANQFSAITQALMRQSQPPTKMTKLKSTTCRDMPIIAPPYQHVSAESPSFITPAHQLSASTQDHMRQSQPPAKVTTPHLITCRDMPIIAPTYEQLSAKSPSNSASSHQLSAIGQSQPPAVTTPQSPNCGGIPTIAPNYQQKCTESSLNIASAHQLSAIPQDRTNQSQPPATVGTPQSTTCRHGPDIELTYQAAFHQSAVARRASAESPSSNASLHEWSAFAQDHIRQSQPPAIATTPQSTTCRNIPIIGQHTYQQVSAESPLNVESAHQLSTITQARMKQLQPPEKVTTSQSITCKDMPIIGQHTYQQVSAESPPNITSSPQLSAIVEDIIRQSQTPANVTTPQSTTWIQHGYPVIEPTYQAVMHQSAVARQAAAESPSSNASLHHFSDFTQTHIRPLQPPAKVTTHQSTTSRNMLNISPIYQVPVHQPSVPRQAINQNHKRQSQPPAEVTSPQSTTCNDMLMNPPIYQVPVHAPYHSYDINSNIIRLLEASVPNGGHSQALYTYSSTSSIERIQSSGLPSTPIMTALPLSQNYYQRNQGIHHTVPEQLTPASAHPYYTSTQYSVYRPQVHATGQRGPVNMMPSTFRNTPATIQSSQLYMRESSGLQNAETATIDRRSVRHSSHSNMCQRQPVTKPSRIQNPTRHPNHAGFPNTYNIQNVSRVPNSQMTLHSQHFPVMTNRHPAQATGPPLKVKKKRVPTTAPNAQRVTAPVTSGETPDKSQFAKEVYNEFLKLLRDNRDDLIQLLRAPTPSTSRLVDTKEVIVIDDDD